MRLFDLHCDTLYRAYQEQSDLMNPDFHISFRSLPFSGPYIQCMAVWIPDEYRGKAAWQLWEGCRDYLNVLLPQTGAILCRTAEDLQRVVQEQTIGLILTVEGGAVLGGDCSNVQRLWEDGVRMMTLTWNGANELGDGIGDPRNRGLTPFGVQVLQEMERCGMTADLSHAGEKLFWEAASVFSAPLVASHSNLRSVCSHRRNLTEEQFQRICASGGLAGLNFCVDFLNDRRTNAGMYDIIRHTEHFLRAGGQAHLAIGADFDGADIPKDMEGLASMPALYDLFVKEFGKKISDAIFFDNAYSFFVQRMPALSR